MCYHTTAHGFMKAVHYAIILTFLHIFFWFQGFDLLPVFLELCFMFGLFTCAFDPVRILTVDNP